MQREGRRRCIQSTNGLKLLQSTHYFPFSLNKYIHKLLKLWLRKGDDNIRAATPIVTI